MSVDPIVSEIKKSKARVFRRLYFKRKYQAGYETDWQQIPNEKIKKWGGISYNIDDIRLNFFNVSGNTIELKNDDSYFSDEGNIHSFFHHTLTRYGTLCKIESGYLDGDGEEYPVNDSTAFIGYLRDDVKTGSNGIVQMSFKHVNSFLEEEFTDRLVLDGAQTASELFEQIRDYTNGSGDQFFSDVIQGWSIKTTTDTYTSLNTASVDGESFWTTTKKLAAAENKKVFVDRTGRFYFADRDFNRTSNEIFHFSGVGDDNKSHGHNIKKTCFF